jgi:hypothetical protein
MPKLIENKNIVYQSFTRVFTPISPHISQLQNNLTDPPFWFFTDCLILLHLHDIYIPVLSCPKIKTS